MYTSGIVSTHPPIIDLKEIPEAHLATGDQDRFELFARDFLEALGFRVVEGPGRGADRGRDLIVGESVAGAVTATERIWVVSAKHKAHSGKSVTDADELDPIGRVRKYEAHGFMAFYSTLPSGGLDDTFARIRTQTDVYVWDRGRIEQKLLSDPRLKDVLQGYFPESVKRLRTQQVGAVRIFNRIEPLNCNYCGKDLLHENGIVAFVQERGEDNEWRVVDMYWSCRGACDRVLSGRLPRGQITAWEGLEDLRIPLIFLRHIIARMNNMQSGKDEFSEVAFDKEKHFILAMAQTVLRQASKEQEARIGDLTMLPDWMGGLGYE
jgi:hypothetical protein